MKSLRRVLETACLAVLLIGLVTCSTSESDPIGPQPPGGGGGEIKPSLVSIDPTFGPAAGGTQVTITGANLGSVLSVTFAGVPARQILFRSSTTLIVVTGAIGNIPASVVGDVTVSNSTGGTGILSNAWTYVAGAGFTPSVDFACPPVWPAEDPPVFTPSELGLDVSCDFDGDGVNEAADFQYTGVVIYGSNLNFVDVTAGADGVRLVQVPVETVLQQNDGFLFVDPAAFGGASTTTGAITVVPSGGGTPVTKPNAFSYIVDGISADTPNATAIEPNVVSASGGVIATITGTQLGNVDRVEFVNGNTVAAGTDITVINDNRIDVVVPAFQGTIPGDQIVGQVTVSEGVLVDPTPVSPFTYVRVLANGRCTSLSPGGGGEGTQITIRGDDLGDTSNIPPRALAQPRVDGITIPTSQATYRDTDGDGQAEEVRFDLNLDPDLCRSGSILVELIDQFGQVLENCQAPFAFEAAFSLDPAASGDPDTPEFTSNPFPNTGDFAGGTRISITGCGLDDTTSVTVCGEALQSMEIDPDGSLVEGIVPPSPSGTNAICDIVVDTPTDQGILDNAFQYTAGDPDGQSIQPAAGPICGETQVRILGENMSGVDIIRFGATGDQSIREDVGDEPGEPVIANVAGTEVLTETPDFSSFSALTPIQFDITVIDSGNDGVLGTPDDERDETPIRFVYSNPRLTTVSACIRPGDVGQVVGSGFRDPVTGRNLIDAVVISGPGLASPVTVPVTVQSSTLATFIAPLVTQTGSYTIRLQAIGDDADCWSSSFAQTLSLTIFITEQDATCNPDGCTDGVDNDGDGLRDEADPDCCDSFCDNPCANEIDDDGDGLTDGFDPNCVGVGDGCTDGVDNNSNGLADEAEPNCFGAGSCDDGVDNDGDGVLDCADPDCAACPVGTTCDAVTGDCVESDCTNNTDDDGDGDIDCLDSDCACPAGSTCNPAGPTGPICEETACNDGVDNDGDALRDEADPDCCTVEPGDAPAVCDNPCANEKDDDGDGFADDQDPSGDCAGLGLGCSDGVDNGDADTLFDEGDPQCYGAGACSDNLDNDGNGFTDEADAGCFGLGSCSDTIDNDGDGCTDADDQDCGGSEDPDCNDGIDNDCDGLIDEADPDCCVFGLGDPRCANPCRNEEDDDGDGLADGNDPNCAGLGDGCRDGIDNDDDTPQFIDEADPACGACDDGIDNDSDGAIDCFDANCCVDGASCPPGSGVCP